MNKNIQTFLGCDADYEEASAVLFGVPFDGTTSFRPGTRFGPPAIRSVMRWSAATSAFA